MDKIKFIVLILILMASALAASCIPPIGFYPSGKNIEIEKIVYEYVDTTSKIVVLPNTATYYLNVEPGTDPCDYKLRLDGTSLFPVTGFFTFYNLQMDPVISFTLGVQYDIDYYVIVAADKVPNTSYTWGNLFLVHIISVDSW
jgi:hypothetical protein